MFLVGLFEEFYLLAPVALDHFHHIDSGTELSTQLDGGARSQVAVGFDDPAVHIHYPELNACFEVIATHQDIELVG